MKQTLTSALWGIMLLLLLSNCSSNAAIEQPLTRNGSSLKISLDSNLLLNSSKSRNNPVKDSNITFYAFTQGSDAEKELLYVFSSAEVALEATGDITTATLKFPSDSEINLSLVALVNVQLDAIKVPIGISYENFKKQLTYSVEGKIENPLLLPYWGINNFNLDEVKNTTLKFNLFRSYARVNIEINEDQENAKFQMKEITSVRVYRSLSNGYANPEIKDIQTETTIAKPNVPTIGIQGKYNTNSAVPVNSIEEANADPLLYTMASPLQKFEDTLFLTESNQNSNTNKSEAVAIIIGVKLKDYDDTERFYRVDFANYKDESVNFMPIIRNHSYVFNMKGAKDEGADNPDEALKTKASVNLDVVDWEDYEVFGDNLNGEYFFRLNNEGIIFSYLENDTKEIEFETNFNNEQLKKFLKIDFAHADSYFRSEIDYQKRTIKISTQLLNNSDNYIEDKLSITLLNQAFEIEMKQRFETAQYVISPRLEHYNLKGAYVVDQPLVANQNAITVRLYSDEQIKSGMAFHLYAEEIMVFI